MFELDPELILDWAGKVSRLKMYPYFDACNYLLMCLAVREDLSTGANVFSRKHPLACWFSSMMMCFAGGILSNVLLGEPVMAVFKGHDDVVLASIIWYLVFYCPGDIVTKLLKLFPVKLVVSLLKEVQRAHKVHAGVLHAAKLYPSSYLIMVAVGVAKGAGAGIVHTFEQFVRGVWVPSGNEFLRPTFYTKACLLAAIVFVVEKKSDLLSTFPHDIIYFTVVAFFVYFKLNALLFHIHDPFGPLENLFCALFMGGFWDALTRAVQASRERRAAAQVEPSAAKETKKEN